MVRVYWSCSWVSEAESDVVARNEVLLQSWSQALAEGLVLAGMRTFPCSSHWGNPKQIPGIGARPGAILFTQGGTGMKQLRYLVLATALAGSAAFAQSLSGPGQAGFVLQRQDIDGPTQAAALHALRGLTAMVGTGRAFPAGFPLAISSVDDLRQLQLGWGFEVNDVAPSQLKAGVPIEQAARGNGQWRYALLSHGKPVGLVTVQRGAQGWQVVSFGGAGLSQDIQRLLDRYPGRNVHFRYVRFPQAGADFIEVRQGAAPPMYAPLRAAQASLGAALGRPGLYSAAELLPVLRTATARNIDLLH